MENVTLLLGAALALAVLFATASRPSLPRAMRVNNPGAIRHGPSRWQGMAAEQPDAELVAFDSLVMGVRAAAKLLRNYERLHGLNTVRGIITRYAPPPEHPTEAYIRNVSHAMGVKSLTPLELANDAVLAELLRAIFHQENGGHFVPDETIFEGIALA